MLQGPPAGARERRNWAQAQGAANESHPATEGGRVIDVDITAVQAKTKNGVD